MRQKTNYEDTGAAIKSNLAKRIFDSADEAEAIQDLPNIQNLARNFGGQLGFAFETRHGLVSECFEAFEGSLPASGQFGLLASKEIRF